MTHTVLCAGGRFRLDLPVLGLLGKGGELSIASITVIRARRKLEERKVQDDPSDYVRIKHGRPFTRAHHTPGTIRDRTRCM